MVSHDEEMALKYASRIIRLKDGAIISDVDNVSEENIRKNEMLNIYNSNNEKITSYPLERINNIEAVKKIVASYNSEIYFNISFTSEKENKIMSVNEKKIYQDFDLVNQYNNLPFSFIKKISWNSLIFKKIRLFFVFILFSLTMTLLSFGITTYHYKQNNVISNYLSEHNINNVIPYRSYCYTNEFTHKQCNDITKGKLFKKSILNTNYSFYVEIKENQIIAPILDSNILSDKQQSIQFKIVDPNHPLYDNIKYYGNQPSKANEIILTDFSLIELFGDREQVASYIGEHIMLQGGREFTVVGVIITNYEDNDLVHRFYNQELTNEGLKIFKNNFLYGIIHPSYVEDLLKNSNTLSLSKANFLYNYSYKLNDSSSEIYTKQSQIDFSNLLYGKKPKNANEVMVSVDFVANHYYQSIEYNQLANREYDQLFIEDKVFNNVYQYDDLYNLKFNGTYDNLLNMKDFFKNNIKIVGIYKNDYREEWNQKSTIAVTDDKFDELKDAYYKYNYIDSYVVYKDSTVSYKEFYKGFENNNLLITDQNVSLIYDFNTTLTNMSSITWIIVVILIIITILLLNSFISISINNKKKQIYILRSLGTRRMDVIKIFILESIFIGLISYLLSLITVVIIIQYINHKFRTSKNIYGYFNNFDIMYFDYINSLLIVLVVLVICILTAYWSSIKLSKLNFGKKL